MWSHSHVNHMAGWTDFNMSRSKSGQNMSWHILQRMSHNLLKTSTRYKWLGYHFIKLREGWRVGGIANPLLSNCYRDCPGPSIASLLLSLGCLRAKLARVSERTRNRTFHTPPEIWFDQRPSGGLSQLRHGGGEDPMSCLAKKLTEIERRGKKYSKVPKDSSWTYVLFTHAKFKVTRDHQSRISVILHSPTKCSLSPSHLSWKENVCR